MTDLSKEIVCSESVRVGAYEFVHNQDATVNNPAQCKKTNFTFNMRRDKVQPIPFGINIDSARQDSFVDGAIMALDEDYGVLQEDPNDASVFNVTEALKSGRIQLTRKKLERWNELVKGKHHLVGEKIKRGDKILLIARGVRHEIPWDEALLPLYAMLIGMDHVFYCDDHYDLPEMIDDIRGVAPLSELIVGTHGAPYIWHTHYEARNEEKPLFVEGGRFLWTGCYTTASHVVDYLLPLSGPNKRFIVEIGTDETWPPLYDGGPLNATHVERFLILNNPMRMRDFGRYTGMRRNKPETVVSESERETWRTVRKLFKGHFFHLEGRGGEDPFPL